jgi:NTP pyrophosphatase (non-canonical NTP hydrolase)
MTKLTDEILLEIREALDKKAKLLNEKEHLLSKYLNPPNAEELCEIIDKLNQNHTELDQVKEFLAKFKTVLQDIEI